MRVPVTVAFDLGEDEGVSLDRPGVRHCPEQEFHFAALLLGVVLDSLDPGWSDIFVRGLDLTHGSLSDRAMEIPRLFVEALRARKGYDPPLSPFVWRHSVGSI